MAEDSGVFVDRPLASDIGLAQLHRRWGVDGVVPDGPDAANRLTITGTGTSQISLSAGYAVVGGWFYRTDTSLSLPVSPNTDSQTRHDLVVVRADTTEGRCFPHIIEGTPGGAVPSPVRDPSGTWDVPLAVCSVAGHSAVVSSSDVDTTVRQFTAPSGAVPCSSRGRPQHPHQGMLVYETDTGRVAVWDGSWLTVSQTRYPTAWQALTLRSGYSHPNHGQSPAWRWDSPGVVRLRGRIGRTNGSVIPHRSWVARLPASARPPGLLSAAVTTTSRHGATAATRGMTSRLEISSASSATAGHLVLWTHYNPTWVGLDGVTFPV